MFVSTHYLHHGRWDSKYVLSNQKLFHRNYTLQSNRRLFLPWIRWLQLRIVWPGSISFIYFWDVLNFWESNVISSIHIMCIHPSGVTVTNSTNQDQVLIALRCGSVHYTDSAYNGGYWHFVGILDSDYPICSIYWYLWPYILRNTIITYLGEYRYGSCWMFVDMIIHSLNHHIMMIV